MRNVRQVIGSNQDIINRANQRIAQDLQARREAVNPLLSRFPGADEVRSGQTGRDSRLVLPGNEQNNTASTGEATQLLLPEQSEIARNRGYPMRRDDAVYKVVEIPQEKVDEISAYIDTVNSATARKKYKKILKNLFSGQTFTNANTVANEISYKIGIGSKGIGEIIARQPVSADTLAMLERLNEVVENAKYIASEPTSHKSRRGIERTDLFETETLIGDRSGVARMRVNVRKDGNKLYFATNKITESNTPQPRAGQGRKRGVEEAPSATNTIITDSHTIGKENPAQVSPDSSVGAAPAGVDAYGRLIGKYGAIEPGENPAPIPMLWRCRDRRRQMTGYR